MPAPSSASPLPPSGATRVLVVSPDPVYARFLRECLEGRGMRVRVRTPPGEPDLTDLDVVLVESLEAGDGPWALIQRVRHQSPLVEIIAIASEPVVDGAVQALRSGVFALLAYPVSDEQLAHEIEAACARKRRAERRIAELEARRPESKQRRARPRRTGKPPR